LSVGPRAALYTCPLGTEPSPEIAEQCLRHPAILSNVIYKSGKNRAILHLLNYQQDRQQNLRVRVRFLVKSVEIFSPDALASKRASVTQRGGESEVVVPELQTDDLVAIYAERK
jgi:hypothetical protein